MTVTCLRSNENHRPGTGEGPDLCRLCGLSLGRACIRKKIEGQELVFCCNGCLHVYDILFHRPGGPPGDFTQTALYRTCVARGIIPGGPEGQVSEASATMPGTAAEQYEEGLSEEIVFRIDGMWCTACALLLSHVLEKERGVLLAEVQFLSDLARIRYLPHRISPAGIEETILKLGYRPAAFEEADHTHKKDLLLRLGISSILTAQIMMISYAFYFGSFEGLNRENLAYFSYPVALMSVPVLFYGGFHIFQRAWQGLRHRKATMDTLIAVGSLSAFVYSLIHMPGGTIHLYFDTAAMLVTLVLLGRFIETGARDRVKAGITELYALSRQKARVLSGGKERWVSSEAVVSGEDYRVEEGERVPVDGRILAGEAEVDESILTGESRPVKKSSGDEVTAGALVLNGGLRLRAVRTGSESCLGQMVNLMQEALAKKNPAEILADRVTQWAVPLILALAAGTAICGWIAGLTVQESMLRAISVLVITCPCAFGIATPLAKIASLGVGRHSGILIRNPDALEKAKDLDVMILDKTGTVTEGRFVLRDIVSPGESRDDILKLSAAVETCSDHFLAREIVRSAREAGLEEMTLREAQVVEGLGVRGTAGSLRVSVGNLELMRQQGLTLSADLDAQCASLERQGMTCVHVGWEGRVRGLLVLGDSLKTGARELITALSGMDIMVELVSGDSENTTQAIASALGIRRYQGRVMPDRKVGVIRDLQSQGLTVGMAGDGLNDAAALVQADVGIALGTGASLSQQAADIMIPAGAPGKILQTLRLSSRTARTIRQNLLFAFIYNAVGIPLAVLGVINPLVAVAAMFASSLTVIGNTLRLSKLRLNGGPLAPFLPFSPPPDFRIRPQDGVRANPASPAMGVEKGRR